MSEIELTKEQEQSILDEWNSRPNSPPSLLKLIKITFPDKDVDGRSKEGRAVKAFLATREIKARGAHEYQPKKVNLTKEQKEYISNNVYIMKAVEMARILFGNDSLNNLNSETKTVNEYIKTIGPRDLYSDPNEIPDDRYRSPKTFAATIIKINRYVAGNINKQKIDGARRKAIGSLTGYLNTYRFIHQINTYHTETERELFESSFVRYANDKPDLSEEEVDQYIVLCTEVVISSAIQASIQVIQMQIDQEVESGQKIPLTLVEAGSTARTEYNQCVLRQQKLLDSLKQKRSDRLSKQVRANASILNLIEVWKDEEGRKKMLKLAELRKKSLKKEIEKLESLDEMKAKILGLSEDEVLNG